MFTNIVRRGETDVRALVMDAMSDREHDPWGSVMATMFSMIEALYRQGYDIPPEYEYRPAPSIRQSEPPDPDEFWTVEFWSLLDANCFADEPMLDWLRVLDKYRALCAEAGRDY